MPNIMRIIKDAKLAIKIPNIEIHLGSEERATPIYNWLNARHPKLPIMRRKTFGVEILKLKEFKDFDDYLQKVNGKNSAAYFRRRILKDGYTFSVIDKNDFVNEIHEINTSKPMRQGRPMTEEYHEFKSAYPKEASWRHFGVFSPDKKLVAYLDVNLIGELAYIGPVLGHDAHLHAGIMYLLFVEGVRELMKEKNILYFMYDMYFGASPGLRLFKTRLGFKPHHVKWLKP